MVHHNIMKKFTVPTIKSIAKSIDSYTRQGDFRAAYESAAEYIIALDKQISTCPEHAHEKNLQMLSIMATIKKAQRAKDKWFFIGLAASIATAIPVGMAFGPTTGWMTVLKFTTLFATGYAIGTYCDKRGNEEALSHYYELSSQCNDDALAVLMRS